MNERKRFRQEQAESFRTFWSEQVIFGVLATATLSGILLSITLG
jgi:hypothetical protein